MGEGRGANGVEQTVWSKPCGESSEPCGGPEKRICLLAIDFRVAAGVQSLTINSALESKNTFCLLCFDLWEAAGVQTLGVGSPSAILEERSC